MVPVRHLKSLLVQIMDVQPYVVSIKSLYSPLGALLFGEKYHMHWKYKHRPIASLLGKKKNSYNMVCDGHMYIQKYSTGLLMSMDIFSTHLLVTDSRYGPEHEPLV